MSLTEYLQKTSNITIIKEAYDSGKFTERELLEYYSVKGITEEELQEALGDRWKELKSRAGRFFSPTGSAKYLQKGREIREIEKERLKGKSVTDLERKLDYIEKVYGKQIRELQDRLNTLPTNSKRAKQLMTSVEDLKNKQQIAMDNVEKEIILNKKEKEKEFKSAEKQDVEQRFVYNLKNSLAKDLSKITNKEEGLDLIASFIKNTGAIASLGNKLNLYKKVYRKEVEPEIKQTIKEVERKPVVVKKEKPPKEVIREPDPEIKEIEPEEEIINPVIEPIESSEEEQEDDGFLPSSTTPEEEKVVKNKKK